MRLRLDDVYTVFEVDATDEDAIIDEDEDIFNYDDVDDPEAFA